MSSPAIQVRAQNKKLAINVPQEHKQTSKGEIEGEIMTSVLLSLYREQPNKLYQLMALSHYLILPISIYFVFIFFTYLYDYFLLVCLWCPHQVEALPLLIILPLLLYIFILHCVLFSSSSSFLMCLLLLIPFLLLPLLNLHMCFCFSSFSYLLLLPFLLLFFNLLLNTFICSSTTHPTKGIQAHHFAASQKQTGCSSHCAKNVLGENIVFFSPAKAKCWQIHIVWVQEVWWSLTHEISEATKSNHETHTHTQPTTKNLFCSAFIGYNDGCGLTFWWGVGQLWFVLKVGCGLSLQNMYIYI